MTSALPFAGAAARLDAAAIALAATALMVDEPTIQAVRRVESGAVGGFLTDGSGRPTTLLEAHLFSRATKGRFDNKAPKVSSPYWNRTLYRGGAAEYDRIALAAGLDRRAALASASWGAFQILASNHQACGYADEEAFVAAMAAGEREQLLAFCGFVKSNEAMAAALRRRDWAAFASRYNGPGYSANAYDKKLAAAYEAAGGMDEGRTVPVLASASTLWTGSRGPQVEELQRALRRAGQAIAVDGTFGRATELALQKFQAARSLQPDGVAGPLTFRALGLV